MSRGENDLHKNTLSLFPIIDTSIYYCNKFWFVFVCMYFSSLRFLLKQLLSLSYWLTCSRFFVFVFSVLVLFFILILFCLDLSPLSRFHHHHHFIVVYVDRGIYVEFFYSLYANEKHTHATSQCLFISHLTTVCRIEHSISSSGGGKNFSNGITNVLSI